MTAAEKIQNITPNHQRSRGAGRLSVKALDGRSRIAGLYQQGCAKIRVPLQHGAAMQAVMINTSGGMTGGDRLNWDFDCGAGTNLTVTTQACERIYKSSGGPAHAHVKLSTAGNARLAWLPQETILFDRGAFERTIEADLSAHSDALFVEPVVFGRETMGERVSFGTIRDRWRICRDGKLIHAEDFALNGEVSRAVRSNAVTGGDIAIATVLLISPAAEGFLSEARQIVGKNGGASFWNGKLLARLTATNSFELRRSLIPLIGLLNHGAALPKTWSL